MKMNKSTSAILAPMQLTLFFGTPLVTTTKIAFWKKVFFFINSTTVVYHQSLSSHLSDSICLISTPAHYLSAQIAAHTSDLGCFCVFRIKVCSLP